MLAPASVFIPHPKKQSKSSNLSPKNKGHLLNPKGKKIKQGAWRWFPGHKSVLENSWPQWPCWCCTSVDAEGERLNSIFIFVFWRGMKRRTRYQTFAMNKGLQKQFWRVLKVFGKQKLRSLRSGNHENYLSDSYILWSVDQWIQNYERKLIQSWCSTRVGTNRNGRGDASKTPAPPVHQCLCFTRRRWLDSYCKGFKPCATRFWTLDQIRKL